MKTYYTRFLRLILGLFLYSLGIVFTLNAQIGYAPWEVLHTGIAKTTGISIGTASIIMGVLIVIVTISLGEKLGLGTILNMFLIGVFLDIILALRIIPTTSNFIVGLIMLVLGLFTIALGSYFYIQSAFGAGPRDSLMVALTRKTGLPIGVCRGTMEILVVLIGWKLGGMVGIGTIISALLIGICIQTTFHLLKFNATEVQHQTLIQTYQAIFKNKDEKEHLSERDVSGDD